MEPKKEDDFQALFEKQESMTPVSKRAKKESSTADPIVIDLEKAADPTDQVPSKSHKLLSTFKLEQFMISEVELDVIDSDECVADALKMLVEKKIHSAPVYSDLSNGYIGFVDLLDIVAWIISTFSESTDSPIFKFDLFEGLKNEEKWFKTPVKDIVDQSTRDPFVPLNRDDTLVEAVKLFGKGIRRIPIIDPGTKSLCGLYTHSMLLKFIGEHIEDILGSVADQTLEELDFADHLNIFTTLKDRAIDAFSLIRHWRVHGVAIVNDDTNKVLVGNLSADDIKLLIRDQFTFSALYQPVAEFSRRIRKEFKSSVSPAVYCHRTDTLAAVIRILSSSHLHRIYIVDDNHKLCGVMSLSDIMQILPDFKAISKVEKEILGGN